MTDMHDDADRSRAGRILFAAVAGLGTIFVLGVAAGFAKSTFEQHESADAFHLAMIGALLAAAALCGWGAFALWPRHRSEPLSPRTRKARRWFNWSVVIGGALGLGLGMGLIASGSPFALLGDDPLPALPIALSLAVYLVVVPLISWRWWINIDEHEADAYRFGALAAGTLYLFVTPSWWLAWRGGFLPEPKHMLIFCAVTLAWCAGWAWRRFR